jgi:hypothetical protein
MTMLLTRIKEIAIREGFEIWEVRRHGKLVRVTENGVLSPYPFSRKMAASKTVNEWLVERFAPSYPGYSCVILKGNGSRAVGQTKLGTVRNTY